MTNWNGRERSRPAGQQPLGKGTIQFHGGQVGVSGEWALKVGIHIGAKRGTP